MYIICTLIYPIISCVQENLNTAYIFDQSSSSHQSMDNKIINSSEYFILHLRTVLNRNIGCPKKKVWGFEI
jgi:hypothetical protein